MSKPIQASNVPEVDRTKIMLAATIKQYGENNVLPLDGAQLALPIEIKVVSFTDKELHLVLLEGKEALEKWKDLAHKQAKEQVELAHEIPNSPGEPGVQSK
jgi:hypothetical protein